MAKRKLPEALKAHQFKKGGKKSPAKSSTKSKGKKGAPTAGGVRSSMPGLVDAATSRHIVRV